jgi:hypothetical protein
MKMHSEHIPRPACGGLQGSSIAKISDHFFRYLWKFVNRVLQIADVPLSARQVPGSEFIIFLQRPYNCDRDITHAVGFAIPLKLHRVTLASTPTAMT